MQRLFLLVIVWLAMVGLACAAVPPIESTPGHLRRPREDGGRRAKVEARVVAWGHGTYKVYVRQSLGEGKVAKVELDGKPAGDTLRFSGKAEGAEWAASYADGAIRGTIGKDGTLELKRVVRQSPTLGAKPPAGAIVLLDGKNFDEVRRSRSRRGEQQWKLVEDGGIEVPKGGMNSKRQFSGNIKLHVEFNLPLMPEARDQGRSNSGVYLPNGDEIQVLDSFGSPSYKGGGCGGLYAYKDPDAFDQFSLASLPPLQWQTYDIEYRVQKKDGKPTGKPRVTVLHNGVKIHDHAELRNDARVGGLHFQDHGNPVQFRNMWVVPLAGRVSRCFSAMPCFSGETAVVKAHLSIDRPADYGRKPATRRVVDQPARLAAILSPYTCTSARTPVPGVNRPRGVREVRPGGN